MVRGKNLHLRPLEKTDLPFLHKLHNDVAIMRLFFEEPYETFRELEDLFEKHIHNSWERRFVIENAEGEQLGVLSLLEIDEINRRAEIDIIIDKEYQGRGYGKEGFILGTKYAFDILNLFKVTLWVLPDNIAARKIYTYVGFKKEATLKKEYFVNGNYVDVHQMCMFNYQWRKRRKELSKEFDLV